MNARAKLDSIFPDERSAYWRGGGHGKRATATWHHWMDVRQAMRIKRRRRERDEKRGES